VPPSSALKLHQELNARQSPLAKLFWFRLAPATQAMMRKTLFRKELEWIEGMKREVKREKCLLLKQAEQEVDRDDSASECWSNHSNGTHG
jgi:hypothetical protein